MLSRVKGPKDIIAGLIFLAAGAALFTGAHEYQMGTATRMGPGYYPAVLGIVLCLFGVAATLKGLLTKIDDPLPNHPLTPLFFMVASVVSFSLLIEPAGLAVASLVCISLACYQRLLAKPVEVLLIFLCLTAFNYVVFIYIFGMTIRIFWWE